MNHPRPQNTEFISGEDCMGQHRSYFRATRWTKDGRCVMGTGETPELAEATADENLIKAESGGKTKLYVAFHHDGQDSQPLIGVASSRDGALKLIREYDILEDHIDALWINHIWDIKEEDEEKKYQLSLPPTKRAYFITEKTLDVFEGWGGQDQLIRADGTIIPSC